ncbi:MAG: N-acetyl sugar amidotransferase [Bacteroidales bacterium]|nr:N-acetyl sugar amidotransferase [Bacteroidales bacterium]
MAYQACKRCVMDNVVDPWIQFDADGFCNHCNNYLKNLSPFIRGTEPDLASFKLQIQKIKQSGKGKLYDCIIGVSGGLDSSYSAYLLHREGVRLLGVHIDNFWNSQQAEENLKKLSSLGIPIERYQVNWDEFKEFQLAFTRASVPEIETPTDIALQAILHEYAKKYNVKYIISGGNYGTEGIKPKHWHYYPKDWKYFKYIVKTFSNADPRKFPFFTLYDEFYYKFIKGIQYVYILNFIPYVKEKAIAELNEKLGWDYYGSKHNESTFTGFVQRYILPEKFKIDYRRATLSCQILYGITTGLKTLTRDEALEILSHSPYEGMNVDEEIEKICVKWNITRKEFDEMYNKPPKLYFDYPNNEKWIDFVYATYKRLFKKVIK